ncbi:uncharacterized beta-barrel protein YwiB (DUF1934 family) [Clostridium algifaecis]|uniref:Uncharacterized beta-barrel protein YwiB (DUF1934 family) n=1 Tax=Clostridium algifaecis TaxID=1472040 RepID=A0ABS4KQR3_9CLOT|nr:DUF1934 domain-containing protein [Clostridium algifaecis]MBP2032368.1 uncharacterized beta-barrel protein YwiB (DUF1934 family) [Clostridium algifaecis]
MKKKAIISVSSKQQNNDDTIEVVTPGEFYKKDDCYYVEYKETEISGMEGTSTTFKMNNDNFSLIRIGSTNANMNFNKNQKSLSVYDTPYGTMELRIRTNKLEVNLDEKGGDVFIDYNLSISGQDYENTQLKINIKA